jgi:DNA-binding HxlR family transcriptional regulator
MMDAGRSGCPINLTLEVLGDRWSLLVIRDIIFGNRRHFRDLLNQSEEGIASNILAERIKRFVDAGFLTRSDDPSHKQKAILSLTEKAIELVPVLAALGTWGSKHTAVTAPMAIRARLLEEGGPALWQQFMDELRVVHIQGRTVAEPVVEQLRLAYEAELESAS